MAQLTAPEIDWATPSQMPQAQSALVALSSIDATKHVLVTRILVAPTADMLLPGGGGGDSGAVGYPISG